MAVLMPDERRARLPPASGQVELRFPSIGESSSDSFCSPPLPRHDPPTRRATQLSDGYGLCDCDIVMACRLHLDSKAMSNLDAIIVGAGHNGLTCAAYLGMAGLRVRVFERRSVVGGACVTEEFHPGFRSSTAAYTVGLLQPKIIRDLNLYEHGLRIVERRVQNFLPLPDGRYLLTGAGRTEREIAKFSANDAARYSVYQTQIRRLVELLRGVALVAPPNLLTSDLRVAMRDISQLVTIGKRL